MPAIMYGKQIVILPKKTIRELQAIENGVYRYLLGVAGYGQVAALRGEVGTSSVESRAMETVLMFTIDTLQGKFEHVKEYMNHEIETRKGRWIKAANTYRQELGLSWEELRTMDRRSLKLKIREWDDQQWREELEVKPTLKWYKEGKPNIQYDLCYTNSISSSYLAKVRTNTLQVEEYF